MDIWKENAKIKVAVSNIPEFYDLLKKADEELRQLQSTLSRLSCFTIDFEVSSETVKHE